jgi:dihydrolipoamide dehydrogenase
MSDDNQTFDLTIIGSGPGGYTGAIRAAQLGLKVAIVEKEKTLGGTCLNVGCIPSKTLLESSEHFSQANHEFDDHGIEVPTVKLNLSKMMARKDKIVGDLTKGIEFLMNKNKITVFFGEGSFKSDTELNVKTKDGDKIIKSKNFLIATGSVPNNLNFEIDEKKIVSSTGALALKEVPKKLAVIGAGVIGLELGSVWARLGSDVTVVEFANNIAGATDKAIVKAFQKTLEKQGLKFKLGHKVNSAKESKKGLTLEVENVESGEKSSMEADVLLVAAGRLPFTKGLGLENTSVKLSKRGEVEIDAHFKTAASNIYAIGDVVKGPMLAHKAEEEGVCLAETLAGQAGHVNYKTVPWVIYTWPEVAWVGQTEEEAKAEHGKVKTGKFPFSANARAKALGTTEGFVKVIARVDNDELLGVHILGPRASDMIAEAVVAMEFGGSAEDLARSFHAHPTLSEVMREAALDVDGNARQM